MILKRLNPKFLDSFHRSSMNKILGNVAFYSEETIPTSALNLSSYVTTDSLLQHKQGKVDSINLPPNSGVCTRFERGDILVANIRPYLKKIWLADINGGCSSDVLVLKCKEGFLPNFLYYALLRDDFFVHLMKGSKGTRMPRGDKEHLLEFLIPDFDFKKQEKISQVLSILDAKIALNKKINNELEAMAKLIYDYWFLQFDFPDENGKPYKSSGGKMVYNEELKSEIPDGWEATPLDRITNFSNQSINPADFPDQEFKLFSIPTLDATKSYGIELGINIRSNKFVLEGNDLLVSKLNPWFNRVVYVMNEVNQICSTEFVVWRTPSHEIKNYLYMVATSPSFIAFCTKTATGTSNSHKRVNPEIMKSYNQPFCHSVAVLLGERLEPMLKKIFINRSENIWLSGLRDWLLPLLMNGQVKMK